MAPRHATRTRLSDLRRTAAGFGRAAFAVCVAALCVACPDDGIRGDDGLPIGAGDANNGGPDAVPGPDGAVPAAPCDMTGRWIGELHTVSTALSADQRATNWYYFEITQSGDRFTIGRALHCGFIVEGTTSVTLSDTTTAAVAATEYAGPGRQGTYKPTADNTRCEFTLDRMYNVRGANKATYLTNVWNVGDPPVPLTMFPPLSKVEPGIEDWDMDTKHGITLKTGLGERYVAQRDWTEHLGTTPQFATQIGGETGLDKLTVKWDSQEAVSDQTNPFLRTSATPKGDGWSRFARAERLTVVDGNDLQTCRNVQQLARDIW